MSGQPRFGCYVGNIDSSVTLERFKEFFAFCGTIVDASLNGKETDPYRYGFIDFATEEARQKAMKYNGTAIQGRRLKVGISKGNVGKPEGYGNTAPAARPPMGHQAPPPMEGDMGGNPMYPPMAPNMMDPNMQMLMMQFLQQNYQANNMPPQAAANMMASFQMGMPPMMQPGGYGRGGYMNPAGRGGMRGAPANPQPSEEVVKLREIQKQQYLDVVRREAEEYKKQEHKEDDKDKDDANSDSSDNEEPKNE
ncbi:RNA recognition motif. (a.k.a. RRM, RBD, or RNP domain), putative [Angomonas deanei]|uniref:RNA recognition motif. (A.k.a. RRM, RBD, or RNP domain), putative n=1 Tax=Angomonas deanei TaxID=59799 RepID=A0A7G2CVA0_9TRYP|nr:RNA recognition motif. (a.k.a. RRM, RBD, or RNP domain), putative [Angomonas deanei]